MAPLAPLAAALALLSLCALPALCSGKTVFYELNVTYGFAAPDCVNKQVLNINGDYPGPTLTGVEGDTMVVIVRNHLSMEAISMHFHGIRQYGTNLADGVGQVTQCAIEPLDFLNQTFVLTKAGTYMYHGHQGDQRGSGLYGKMWVYERPDSPLPYKYDGELAVVLNDWYHRSIYEQVAGLDNIPFIWIGEPQSLLMNGRGEYNCSLVPKIANPLSGDAKVCNSSAPDCDIEVFEVEQGKTYRFRIASLATLSAMNWVLEGHTFTVIMADAFTVKPFVVGEEGLDVYTGQTYDVIFQADQPVGNYWVRTAVFARNPNTPFGKAVLRYKGAEPVRPTTPLPPVRIWNDTAAALFQATRLKGLMQGQSVGGQVPPVPLFPGETVGSGQMPVTEQSPVLMLNSQQKVQGHIRWAVNNISLELPPVPYVLGINTTQDYLYVPDPQTNVFTPWDYTKPPPTDATYGSGYYQFNFNATIDIVLQNANTLTPGVSEYHPWHMHGHQFWVLGYGFGTFEPKDHASFNFVDPPFRNTVTLLPYGWVAIRFVANNPGAWMFHCHIAPHMHMGMQVIIVDGYLLPLPEKIQRCGLFF